jgi:hypothetical protein
MLFDVKISKLFQRMEDAEKDATTDSTANCLHPPSPSSSSKPAENGTTVTKNDEELLADINSHYRKGLQLQRNSDTASGFREAADQFRHAIDIV